MLQIPHDVELEEHIIGCMLFDKSCIADIVEIVKPRYFYHEKYAKLYDEIVKRWTDNPNEIDIVALAPVFEKLDISMSRMAEVMQSVPTVATVRVYAERLRDIAALRYAVQVGQTLIESATLRDGEEIKQAIATAVGKLSRISEATIKLETTRRLKDLLVEFYEEFERNYYHNDSGITGIPSGFATLDRITAGFQNSDLIIVAARPSVGKTALMLQLAKNLSIDKKIPGAIFSLEMSGKSLAKRIVANMSGIDLQKINSALVKGDEWDKMTTAIGLLSEGNLIIDDQSGATIADIKAKARRIQREHGLEYIMVDYLGMIQAPEKGMSRYDQVSENTRRLKSLAREFDVPVICLCQLSRSVEQRQDKKPLLSDLRESGEIEQTADLVIFLHREDYYDAETERKNIMELIIAKNRNGPTGSIELAFLKQYNRFAEITTKGA